MHLQIFARSAASLDGLLRFSRLVLLDCVQHDKSSCRRARNPLLLLEMALFQRLTRMVVPLFWSNLRLLVLVLVRLHLLGLLPEPFPHSMTNLWSLRCLRFLWYTSAAIVYSWTFRLRRSLWRHFRKWSDWRIHHRLLHLRHNLSLLWHPSLDYPPTIIVDLADARPNLTAYRRLVFWHDANHLGYR